MFYFMSVHIEVILDNNNSNNENSNNNSITYPQYNQFNNTNYNINIIQNVSYVVTKKIKNH